MTLSLAMTNKKIRNQFFSLNDTFPKITPFFLGCFFSLSFEPFGIVFAAVIICPFLLLKLLEEKDWRGAFKFGWWFGFGHYLTSLYWIGNSFLQQSSVPIWMAPMAVIALAYVLAYFFSLTFALTIYFKGPDWTKVIAFSSLWSILEWIKGHILTGFPWNPLGGIWTSFEPIMQFASIVGVFGLTFFTILAFSSLVFLLTKGKNNKAERLFLGLNGFVFVLIFVFGQYRLTGAEVEYHSNLNFRVVQANISQKEKWVRENWSGNFYKHIEMSKR